ncbi:MAG TPA: DUF4147 domain-containing protein, partial [Candidatus Acidoferrum sp.]
MRDEKQTARQIFQRTLASIHIPEVMERKVAWSGSHLALPDASVDLSQVSRVQVVAIGKAAHAMVTGLLRVVPPGTPLSGIVAAPTQPEQAVPGFEYFVAGHPVPNGESWKAAKAVLR